MTDRAGRRVIEQVGGFRRTVAGIAVESRADWHTINDTAIAYDTAIACGTGLDGDLDRIGATTALSLDEILFGRFGPWRTQADARRSFDPKQMVRSVYGHNDPATAQA